MRIYVSLFHHYSNIIYKMKQQQCFNNETSFNKVSRIIQLKVICTTVGTEAITSITSAISYFIVIHLLRNKAIFTFNLEKLREELRAEKVSIIDYKRSTQFIHGTGTNDDVT